MASCTASSLSMLSFIRTPPAAHSCWDRVRPQHVDQAIDGHHPVELEEQQSEDDALLRRPEIDLHTDTSDAQAPEQLVARARGRRGHVGRARRFARTKSHRPKEVRVSVTTPGHSTRRSPASIRTVPACRSDWFRRSHQLRAWASGDPGHTNVRWHAAFFVRAAASTLSATSMSGAQAVRARHRGRRCWAPG